MVPNKLTEEGYFTACYYFVNYLIKLDDCHTNLDIFWIDYVTIILA